MRDKAAIAPEKSRLNGAPRLTTRPVGETLWSLSWPTTIGLFAVLAFNVIDTLYVGRLGPAELAALGFCFPVIFSLGAVGFGLSVGATAVMSQAIGAGDTARMRTMATNSFVFGLLAMAALALIGMLTIDPLFSLLGASEEVMPHVRGYLGVYLWGLPVIMAPVLINGFMRATGEVISPAAIMVAGALMNAAVSPILIFGLFGAPRLEIAGAAWGTIAARMTMTAFALILVQRRERLFILAPSVFRDFSPSVAAVTAVGLPAIGSQIITPLSSAVVTRLLSGFGEDVVAAFAIGARLEALFLIAFWALQSGIAPFTGQNYGAGRQDRLVDMQRWIFRFVLAWAAFTLFTAGVFGEEIAQLFTHDSAIAAMSADYFLAVAAGFAGAGLMLASTAALNSIKKPLLATSIVILRFFVLYIPLGVGLSALFGPAGVFAAAGLSYLIAGAAGALLVRRTMKRLSPFSPAAPSDRAQQDPAT